MRLHDTAAGTRVPVGDRRTVSLYVCGPTVHDVPHVGHARLLVVFDVLRRHLTSSGVRVRHVSNVTDVDDKIVARAEAEGVSWREVAARNEEAWWRLSDALGVARPDAAPRASEHVGEVVELVAELRRRGVAYETPDGVLFDVSAVAGYGLLARVDPASRRARARVTPGPYKRSAADFALWRPTSVGPTWPSPWGPGRPGWHSECVVLSTAELGRSFDLHGGGADLAFPHHENERAQAVALGWPFASLWLHAGLVETSGTKMSRSLGNVATLEALTADPRAFRLLVLRAGWRSPLEVDARSLAEAEAAVARLDAFARRFAGLRPDAPCDEGALGRLRAALDDDLATPRAVAELFGLVARANRDDDPLAAATALVGWRALGLDLGAAAGPVAVPEEVAALVEVRERARAARDWAAADAARARIAELGWVVEDAPEGTRLRRAGPGIRRAAHVSHG